MAMTAPPVPRERDAVVPTADATPTPPDLAALRRFHLRPPVQPAAGVAGLQPAAAPALRDTVPLLAHMPLVVTFDADEDPAAQGLRAWLDTALEAVAPDLHRHVGALVARVQRALLASRAPATPLDAALRQALEEWVEAADASDAARADLREQAAKALEQVPTDAVVVALGPGAGPWLVVRAAVERRRRAWLRMQHEVRELVTKVRARLAADDAIRPEAGRPEAIAGALGQVGSELIDPARLAAVSAPSRRGSQPLPLLRRKRLEEALAALETWLSVADSEPDAIVVSTPNRAGDRDFDSLGNVDLRPDDHPIEAAAAIFDEEVERMLPRLRAVRLARLEVRRHADVEAIYERSIAPLRWDGLRPNELELLVPIVALEDAQTAATAQAGALWSLLHAGRPVRVVLRAEALPELGQPGDLAARLAADPTLLALAHREAFAASATLARPTHLWQAAWRATAAPRPAVLHVAEPCWQAAIPPDLALEAAHVARCTPALWHDPDAGTSLADTFTLGPHEVPEAPWVEFDITDPEVRQAVEREAWTPAHAVLLAGHAPAHFLPAPGVDADELVPIATWALKPPREAFRTIPFVWARRPGGPPVRCAVSRPLALAVREWAGQWRMVQELAGAANEYARRAAERARREALDEAAERIAQLQEEHHRELEEVRRTAAAEALERVAAALVGLDVASLSVPAPSSATAPAAALVPQTHRGADEPPEPAAGQPTPTAGEQDAQVEGAAQGGEAAAAADEGLGDDEPRIDSELCTSCNECINLNGQLFRYNADKQAEIADPSAGTYAQLVEAAEKCPAHCIHPGKPRPDDPTATPDVLARAAALEG